MGLITTLETYQVGRAWRNTRAFSGAFTGVVFTLSSILTAPINTVELGVFFACFTATASLINFAYNIWTNYKTVHQDPQLQKILDEEHALSTARIWRQLMDADSHVDLELPVTQQEAVSPIESSTAEHCPNPKLKMHELLGIYAQEKMLQETCADKSAQYFTSFVYALFQFGAHFGECSQAAALADPQHRLNLRSVAKGDPAGIFLIVLSLFALYNAIQTFRDTCDSFNRPGNPYEMFAMARRHRARLGSSHSVAAAEPPSLALAVSRPITPVS